MWSLCTGSGFKLTLYAVKLNGLWDSSRQGKAGGLTYNGCVVGATAGSWCGDCTATSGLGNSAAIHPDLWLPPVRPGLPHPCRPGRPRHHRLQPRYSPGHHPLVL